MVFWKLHAKSGMSYEQVAKHSFHISRAVLDLESNLEGKTSVIIEVQDEETIICHLSSSYDQAPLDLNFEKGEHLKIIIHGNSDVHLSGYTLDKEKEVTFNESPEEISKKRKRKTKKDTNNLSSPKQENGLLQNIKSEETKLSQNGASEQKLSKKAKKMTVKENGESFCILDDANSKKKAKKEKKSEEKLSDLLSKSYEEEEDDEDEEYILDEEEIFEEEGDEEDEDEDMEEDEDEAEEADDDDEDDKEADDDEEDDKEEDEEDDKEAIDLSNGDLEEDKDLFTEESPEKRKRPLSPPSSAGRTPMVRSSKKAKKQEVMASPEMTPVSLKQKKQKVTDSPAVEKEIKTPQSALKKEIRKGGLLCEDIKVGTGKEAKIGKKLTVYYEGKLKKNGYTFDKIRSGPGFQFKLGTKDIIEAWNVGIVGMKVGGKRKIVVPPNMAYGKEGHPPEIPPNAFLNFEIDLKSVK